MRRWTVRGPRISRVLHASLRALRERDFDAAPASTIGRRGVDDGEPGRRRHFAGSADTTSVNAFGAAGAKGFDGRMESALWGRLSVEARSEVDRLVSAGRTVQAIAVMRDRVGPPRPSLHECVDLVSRRHTVLRQGGPTHR